ncbi:MAG TPA: response regulator, partial [Longimicrobiales bacterium]|nr:response regulator [Longimicrobiales bacterium]
MAAQSVRVLLVDDDTANARRIRRTLTSEAAPTFHVDEADALQAAEQQLQLAQYDVVLLNLAHAGVSGLGSLAVLQTAQPRLPIVVLAPAARESLALKAVQQGAVDYLINE